MTFYSGGKSKTPTDYVVSFNTTLRKLTNGLVTQFPDDAIAARIKKRVTLAVNEAPVSMIEYVGLILYSYRAPIYSNNIGFFLKKDYSEELMSGKDNEKRDMASYILPKLKEALRQSSKEKQKMYLDQVQDLLDDYIEYLCLTNKK